MGIIREVRPVTTFIGGEESIVELLEQYRTADAAQLKLFADFNRDCLDLGGRSETAELLERLTSMEVALAEAKQTLETERVELERLRLELEAVRIGRNRLYADYRRLQNQLGAANVEEQE